MGYGYSLASIAYSVVFSKPELRSGYSLHNEASEAELETEARGPDVGPDVGPVDSWVVEEQVQDLV